MDGWGTALARLSRIWKEKWEPLPWLRPFFYHFRHRWTFYFFFLFFFQLLFLFGAFYRWPRRLLLPCVFRNVSTENFYLRRPSLAHQLFTKFPFILLHCLNSVVSIAFNYSTGSRTQNSTPIFIPIFKNSTVWLHFPLLKDVSDRIQGAFTSRLGSFRVV